jgi:WD40 repeat protein
VAPRSNFQVSLGKAISNVSFSRGGEFVVTVDREGGARIWDVATWRSTRISLPSRHMVFSATIDPDGRRLALTGVGATLWSVNGPGSRAELIRELVEPDPFFPAISVASFSADGKRLVTLAGNEVSFWDARTGNGLGSTGTRIEETPASVAFTPAGLLVTAHEDGTARLWNVEEPEAAEQVLVLQGHTERINDAHISRDGLFVVTASDDRTARVWESGSGRLLAVLRGHADAVRTAEFSSDGTRIWTASADGVLRQFTCEPCLPLEDLIQLGNWGADTASESESSE